MINKYRRVPRRRVVCVDFDGVIYKNMNYKGTAILNELPVEGAIDALQELAKSSEIVINSARCESDAGMEAVQNWLNKHEIPYRLSKHKQEYDRQYRQDKKAKNKEKSMELKDQDKILTRIETEVTAETLADSMDKMKIYLMALMSIAYEVDEDVSDKITVIHEAMSVEVDDMKIVSQSLECRAQEVVYND